jgi:hypothetical protein
LIVDTFVITYDLSYILTTLCVYFFPYLTSFPRGLGFRVPLKCTIILNSFEVQTLRYDINRERYTFSWIENAMTKWKIGCKVLNQGSSLVLGTFLSFHTSLVLVGIQSNTNFLLVWRNWYNAGITYKSLPSWFRSKGGIVLAHTRPVRLLLPVLITELSNSWFHKEPSVLVLTFSFVGPCPHWDRDYHIGSKLWKFYLIKTSFTLNEPVSLVKVFRRFRLERKDYFGVHCVDTVSRCTTSYLLAGQCVCDALFSMELLVWSWYWFSLVFKNLWFRSFL